LQPFLAATFDFPTFFTQAFKAAPLFHSLAVFEQISLLFCDLLWIALKLDIFSYPSSYADTMKTDL